MVKEVVFSILLPKLDKLAKKSGNKYDDTAVEYIKDFLDYVVYDLENK